VRKGKRPDRWETEPGWIWGIEWTHIAILLSVVVLGSGAFFVIRAVLHARTHVRALRASVEGMIVAVGPRFGGRITSLLVEPGQEVKAGQVLAWMDRDALEAAEREARAKLLAAQAQVRIAAAALERETALARGGFQESEADLKAALSRLGQAGIRSRLEESRTESEIAQARAALEEAEARLARLKAGPRREELEIAQAALRAAETKVEAAQKDLRRKEKLLAGGFISAGQMEAVQAQADIARAERDQAARALELLRAGSRKEDIEIAQLEVAKARAALAVAEAQALGSRLSREEEMERGHQVQRARAALAGAAAGQSQMEVARREVEAGLAQVEMAAAGLRAAQSALAEARIKSPLKGTVVEVLVHPGEIVGPGQSVALVVSGGRFWIEASIPEREVRKVGVGQPAKIEIHAYPKLRLSGKVAVVGRATLTRTKSYASSSTEGAGAAFSLAPEVPVIINFNYGRLRLSPGMSARVEIDVRPR